MERQLAYALTVLPRTRLSEDEEARLDQIVSGSRIYELIRERRSVHQEIETTEAWIKDYEARNAALERGEELAAGVGADEELLDHLSGEVERLAARASELETEISTELSTLGVSSEAELLRMVEDEFPRMWVDQAKEIAIGMLATNREQVRAERERYPPDYCTIDTAELQAADAQIYEIELRRRERQAALASLEQARQTAPERLQAARQLAYDAANEPGGLPGGVPPSAEEIETLEVEVADLDQQVEQAETEMWSADGELRDLIRSYASSFPILASPEYIPGIFARATEEEVSRLTGNWTETILENIDETEENIIEEDIKVWDLIDVPQLTFQQMGVNPESVLGQAVQAHIADETSDESMLAIARAVFEVAVTVAATILTAPTGGWGGLVVGAAFTAGHVYEGVQEFQAEQAASRIALDPEIADISRNEPEIGWIILDIASLGLEVGPIVRALRPAARSLALSGDARALREFSEAVARAVPPEAAESLIRSAGRRVGATADEVAEIIIPQSRRANVSRPDLLARYEQAATQKMPGIVADALTRQRSTPTRRRLQELYDEFDALRTNVHQRSLTSVERARAEEILREARSLARSDFSTLQRAIWRRLRRDPELKALADEMVAAGDAQAASRSGTVRIHTQWDDGRTGFQPLEIEHRTRLSDNPWRYNDPDNLILTDSAQNQQYLEALRREGGIWATDEIEGFIVSHGLGNAGAPGAR